MNRSRPSTQTGGCARAGLAAIRPVSWDRLIVRPDGRAHVELTVGIPDELAAVDIEQVDGRVLVTVMLGIERSSSGRGFAAIGIPATASLELPMRIVDGSRAAHRP